MRAAAIIILSAACTLLCLAAGPQLGLILVGVLTWIAVDKKIRSSDHF